MITEHQQELASLYALGLLDGEEKRAFEAALRENPALGELTGSLQQATDLLALTAPRVAPPAGLKEKVMRRIDAASAGANTKTAQADEAAKRETLKVEAEKPEKASAGRKPAFNFVGADATRGWKELPVRGAWIKLLSIDQTRGYAVLLGKLEAGVRYPAHSHEGAEELYILTGDLHIGDRALGPGDFHHADAGTAHPVNYSVEGCTLIAVLPAEHELVHFAMA